jgi:regulator of sirC expression with transglutaminase-like and TPR domain
MMDEPNEDIYSSIRDKIITYGLSAIPLLEDAWLKTDDDDNALRIEMLIDDIRFTDTYHELFNWAQFYSHDLLKAFTLLTRFRYPEMDEEKYMEKVSRLKQNIWLEINQDLTALEKVKVLNHIFFDVYKYRGQLPQQVSINAHFLTDLIDTSKGSAIALGILYLYIAQSLEIPIFGVDLHHHFVLAYMEDNIPVKNPEAYKLEEVLFYIAVVNKGSVFTRNEINRYLKQAKLEDNPSYFLPCNNVEVIRKLITEMVNTYEVTAKPEKAVLFNKLLEALD